MSRSPYFFVERFNEKTEKYEFQHPLVWNWDHTQRIPADLFPYNGCHDLFSIVEDNHGEFPTMYGIHHGLPKDVSPEIKETYDKCCYEIDWTEEKRFYTPTAHWFTYADMYIYCLENPLAKDYEAMDEACFNAAENEKIDTIYKPTPLKALMDRVDAFLEVMDGWDWRNDFSQIRIVYWIE